MHTPTLRQTPLAFRAGKLITNAAFVAAFVLIAAIFMPASLLAQQTGREVAREVSAAKKIYFGIGTTAYILGVDYDESIIAEDPAYSNATMGLTLNGGFTSFHSKTGQIRWGAEISFYGTRSETSVKWTAFFIPSYDLFLGDNWRIHAGPIVGYTMLSSDDIDARVLSYGGSIGSTWQLSESFYLDLSLRYLVNGKASVIPLRYYQNPSQGAYYESKTTGTLFTFSMGWRFGH
jgi:hypothetical protein